MTFWQLPAHLATDPAVVEVTAAGVVPLPFDLAALLGPGQMARAARTTLTDLTTGQIHPLPAARLEAGGTRIVQVIRGLVAGRDYRLAWVWEVSDDDQPSRLTIIRVVG